MRVLGVDPGGTGALALLTEGGLVLEVHDMPVLKVSRGRGTRTEVEVHGLCRLLSDLAPDVCFFERVQGMEGDGVSSAFNFGRAAGAAEAIIKSSGARFEFVTPPAWKRGMGLIGTAKDDGRAKAMNLWPANAAQFSRKRDDGRADAALIAEFGRRKLIMDGVFG